MSRVAVPAMDPGSFFIGIIAFPDQRLRVAGPGMDLGSFFIENNSISGPEAQGGGSGHGPWVVFH